MAESAHRTFAVPETAQYPEPPASIIDHSLRAAIFGLCDKLADATAEYAVASLVLRDVLLNELGAADARRIRAEHDVRVVGMACKSLCARLAALTALVGVR